MTDKPPRTRAAGAIIAFAVIAGAIIGTMTGQPTIGVLAGFGASVLFALLLWLWDRR
jgi:hypothetical protein